MRKTEWKEHGIFMYISQLREIKVVFCTTEETSHHSLLLMFTYQRASHLHEDVHETIVANEPLLIL